MVEELYYLSASLFSRMQNVCFLIHIFYYHQIGSLGSDHLIFMGVGGGGGRKIILVLEFFFDRN